MKLQKLLTICLVSCMVMSMSANAFAEPASEAPSAGESAEGESPNGESPDGESPDGESPDGESPDGESVGTSGDDGDGRPDTSLGGNATSRPPDNSTKAINILGGRAALYFEYGENGYTVHNNLTDSYQTTGVNLEPPVFTANNEIKGLYIECASIDWDDENKVGNSGLVINGLTDTETTFDLGGSEDLYDAPDGKKYNSVIIMNVDENEEYDTSATETAAGCGIAFNGKSIRLNNVFVDSNGTGRPAIHIPSQARDKNVTQYSDLICVDSTITNHGTRALLLMGGDVWFLNSLASTDKWGALSYDNTNTIMYVVNSTSLQTGTGYSIYDAAGCEVYVYGSMVSSGGTGITVCRDAILGVNSLDKADETATAPYNGSADLMVPAATADGKSVIVGYTYPIKIHADMSGPDTQAVAYINDAYLSSCAEDVITEDNKEYVSPGSSSGSTGSDRMNALVNDYEEGEIVEIACHSGKVVFDNCELNSRNNVLVHSFFAYDTMASGIYPVDGSEYIGDEIVFKNMSAEGDILHEDYMRKMIVSLENAQLTGKVTGTTLTGWNNYWKDQIEHINGDEEDAKLVIRDDVYETLWGVRMTMDASSTWNVSGTSQLYSFSMEEGAVVNAADGKNLTIYVDCPMGNDMESYDITKGTQIDAFENGVEYTGVVIIAE